MTFGVDEIARVCHEGNRGLQLALGGPVSPPWDQCQSWLQASVMRGVRFRLDNPTAPCSELHSHWMRDRIAAGWRLGEKKDEDAKRHPNLVPWEELPRGEQVKDELFTAIVTTLAPLALLPPKAEKGGDGTDGAEAGKLVEPSVA